MRFVFLIFSIIISALLFSCNNDSNKDVNESNSHNYRVTKVPDMLISGKDTFYSGFKKIIDTGYVFYEDAIFLKGVYKLNSITYPSVGIIDKGDRKIINYHYDSSSSYTLVYKKIGNYWLTKYFVTGDTAKYYYTYKYLLLGNQSIAFTYTNPEQLWFSDVVINKPNSETIYKPKEGFSIPPSLDQLSLLLSNYDYKHETTIIENEKFVEMRSIRTSFDGSELLRFSSCFKAENKSYSFNWWQMHGSLQKEIQCDSLPN